MKKLIFLSMMLLACGAIYSQSYTASNGAIYNVGDTITIGLGSNPDGSFKFVEMSGAKALLLYEGDKNSLSASKDIAGFRFPIKKIKTIKWMGNSIVVFYTEHNFAIQVESAIRCGELK